MKSLFNLLLITSIFVLGSCNSGSNYEENDQSDVAAYKDEDKFESRIKGIDEAKDLLVANSLSYSNNANSTAEVTAYLDKSERIVKMEELFSDGISQEYGTNTFYIENGKKFATRQVYYDTKGKKPMFVERITYYDGSEKPMYAKERKAEIELDLDGLPFSTVKAQDCSVDRAMRILNQEGEFETTFQGFATDGSMHYLIVGENSAEGYASSLAVQHTEGDIAKLMNNEKAMIGTPLEVQYERMMDERDFQFQILLNVKIKE